MLFEVSGDGHAWQPLGDERITPVDDSARLALTAGGRRGAAALFTVVTLAETPAPLEPPRRR